MSKVSKEKLKKKISDEYKRSINEIDFGDNLDMKKSMEAVANDPEKVLFEDDLFNFDGSRCITNCDGNCCIGVDMVRVTPIDIEVMFESDAVKEMGWSWNEFVTIFFDIFSGDKSKIPMGIIKFIKEKNFCACPFLIPVKKFIIEGEAELRKLHQELLIGTNDKKRRKAIEKRTKVGGVCVLGQNNKPSICMLAPLGRFFHRNEENLGKTSKIEDMIEFYAITQDCACTDTTKTIKVKDFLKGFKEYNVRKQKYYDSSLEVVKKINKTFDSPLIRNIMYDFFCSIMFSEGKTEEKIEAFSKFVDSIKIRIYELLDAIMSGDPNKIKKISDEINKEIGL